MQDEAPVHLGEIRAAARRIAGCARHTPLVPSRALSDLITGDVRLKLETLQDTGSFKLRGAANAILALPEAARRRGVVAYSTGNHGRAVAHIAARLGVPATICVSRQVTPAKIAALKAAGCRLLIEGRSQDEAAENAFRLQREQGLSVIDPVNDRDVLCGQGTIGLEMTADWPEVDTVIVPLSGGALLAGIALAVKETCPRSRLVGVSMEGGAAMHASLQAGRPVQVEEVESLADSLQGGIGLDNKFSFAMVRDLVDEIILVSEEEIARAMAWGYWRERLVLEGAAATPIAALLKEPSAYAGRRVGLVITGNAVDGARLADIVVQYRDAVAATPPESAARGAA